MIFDCKQLSAALRQLPFEQRAIVELTYYYGYKLVEIAADHRVSGGDRQDTNVPCKSQAAQVAQRKNSVERRSKLSSKANAGSAQCEDVWMLIPWYVNGTLGQDEVASVEYHSRICAGCASEIREQSRLAATLSEITDEEAALDRSWASLSAQVAQEVQARQPRRQSEGVLARLAKLAGRFRTHLSQPALALSAAALLLVILLQPDQHASAPYETLTLGEQVVTGASIRVRVRARNLRRGFCSDRCWGWAHRFMTGHRSADVYTTCSGRYGRPAGNRRSAACTSRSGLHPGERRSVMKPLAIILLIFGMLTGCTHWHTAETSPWKLTSAREIDDAQHLDRHGATLRTGDPVGTGRRSRGRSSRHAGGRMAAPCHRCSLLRLPRQPGHHRRRGGGEPLG